MIKEGEESVDMKQSSIMSVQEMIPSYESRELGQQALSGELSSVGNDEPSLIQYRSKRRCVMEREKKKKKEWWEEEDMLSDEEEYFEDADSDTSDNPRRKRRKKGLMPMSLLPPPPNRIYVFSTELANRAADAVVQGRVPSIVAYHRAQPQNQNLLRLHRGNMPADYGMNHGAIASNMNPYRYGNYPGQGMYGSKAMGDLLESQVGGRGGAGGGAMSLAGGYNNMHQYQQYLKQQQQQQQQSDVRTMAGVNDIQQMLFGTSNGAAAAGIGKPMMPPSPADSQVGPAYGYPAGFRSQQMMPGLDGSQPEERFRFPQPPQNYHNQAIVSSMPQQMSQPIVTQPALSIQQPSQVPPVLSPTSSASSSSSHGIRSPPPYPNSRAAEPNTLPGASTVVGIPSPTNTDSPKTTHGSLTPRLMPTSLASPQDGPPFSPSPGTASSGGGGGGVTASGVQTSQASYTSTAQSTTTGMKQHPVLARQSPSLENAGDDNKPSISSPYQPIMADQRFHGQDGSTNQQQRPTSLDLSREDNQGLPPPPNRSPFLPGSSPMVPQHPLVSSTASPHHSSKSFSVESLTAPTDKARLYRPPTIQGASPYGYAQQPGLFYPGQKFPPTMLGQGQFQLPPHMQPTPQQFFPPNLPPNMYLPRGAFPIHHAGNRDGGV